MRCLALLNKIFNYKYKNKHIVITLLGFIRFKIKTKNIKAFNNTILLHYQDGRIKEVDINKIQGLKISMSGSNNTIKIYEPYCFKNCKLYINGNNNIFEVFATKKSINNTVFNMQIRGENRRISIGKNCYIGEALLINNNDHSSILIGNDCMLSANIHIRTADGHVICQSGTKNIINFGGDVDIGKHSWIARDVFINKNVSIPNDTIIGAGALVTKSFFETNTILAGVPAKIVKRNVDWYYNRQELEENFNGNNLELKNENKTV